MNIRITSDIHLDSNRGWLLPRAEVEDVLIIAGDLAEGHGLYSRFFEDISARFNKVFIVFGNHDFYDIQISGTPAWSKHLPDNIKVLNNESMLYGDINFHGTTLWTDFSNANEDIMEMAQRYMYDYRATWNGIRLMKPDVVLEAHYEALEFIRNINCEGVNILITHHMPNIDFVADVWKGQDSNPLFHANMDWNVLDRFDYIICGHTHTAKNFFHGNTECIINPLGYKNETGVGSDVFRSINV